MYRIVHSIFDILFPPSVDAYLVRKLTERTVRECYLYKDTNGMYSLSSFHDVRIRALIHEAKFYGNKKAFSLLGALFLYHIETKKPQIDMVIPIPLSRARLRARGYNQMCEILTACGDTLPFPILRDVLIRTHNTTPQTRLSRERRLINVEDAFDVTHHEHIFGKHILLIDDVMTTGATLRAAKAALMPHSPASVVCVALAH